MSRRYDVKWQKLVLSTPLPMTEKDWRDVGSAIKVGVRRGIESQRQVDGTAYAPLKPETVRRKMKKGSPFPTKRLIDTTNLLNNQRIELHKDGKGVDVIVGPTRKLIAYFQQVTPGAGNVRTLFFGLSAETKANLLKLIDIKLTKWISKRPSGT